MRWQGLPQLARQRESSSSGSSGYAPSVMPKRAILSSSLRALRQVAATGLRQTGVGVARPFNLVVVGPELLGSRHPFPLARLHFSPFATFVGTSPCILEQGDWFVRSWSRKRARVQRSWFACRTGCVCPLVCLKRMARACTIVSLPRSQGVLPAWPEPLW